MQPQSPHTLCLCPLSRSGAAPRILLSTQSLTPAPYVRLMRCALAMVRIAVARTPAKPIRAQSPHSGARRPPARSHALLLPFAARAPPTGSRVAAAARRDTGAGGLVISILGSPPSSRRDTGLPPFVTKGYWAPPLRRLHSTPQAHATAAATTPPPPPPPHHQPPLPYRPPAAPAAPSPAPPTERLPRRSPRSCVASTRATRPSASSCPECLRCRWGGTFW